MTDFDIPSQTLPDQVDEPLWEMAERIIGAVEADATESRAYRVAAVAGALDDLARYVEGRIGVGVYSDIEIARAILDGHIVIHPLTPSHIKGSSYDVTLNENFYAAHGDSQWLDITSARSIAEYFGDPLVASPQHEAVEHVRRRGFQIEPYENLPPEHPVIPVYPGERLLCCTNEFIGIKPPGTTEMRARSSSGRIGIAACFCAGWGDPGYINRWTMEVYNLNLKAVVLLPVNMRIAQIIFHHTGACLSNYGLEGKYQAGTDVRALEAEWRPDAMLPKTYKDSVPPVMGNAVPSFDELTSLLAPWLNAAKK